MATKKKKKSAPRLDKMDIIRLITEDHKPLKQLIKVLTSDKKDLEEKRAAFEEFAPLLLNHAKPEEMALYMKMRDNEELKSESYEAETEHQLAERVLEEVKSVQDEDEWEGKVKVMAELVQHHIEEEEEELLKQVKREFSTDERLQMGEEFFRMKSEALEQEGEMPEEIAA